MIYIRDELFNDIKNKEKVYKLFEEEEICIKPYNYDPKSLKKKLIKMGERKIAEKYCK